MRQGVQDLPTTAYQAVKEVSGEGKEIQSVFKHISCSIQAEEAEEVILFNYFLNKINIVLI